MRTGDPKPTSPSLESNSNFEFFQAEIKSVIKEINKRSDTDLKPIKPGQVFIDENGIKLSTPQARLGKHALVYILNINKNGSKFDCVLRNQIVDAENYTKAMNKKPVVKKFLPKLYGVEDGWVVMEELNGLELDEVGEKLINDDTFRKNYARNCSEAVYLLTNNDIYLNDINFTDGHNVKVQEDGSFKFIEQAALQPEAKKVLEFTIDEVLSERIFTHLENWKLNDTSNLKKSESLCDFEFQFLYNLINKTSPENILVKHRYLLPSHEYYKDSFNSYSRNKEFWVRRNFKELEEGEYEKLVKPPLPWIGNEYNAGKRLNPEFINAIKNHEIEKFIEMINKKEAVLPLENTQENIVTLH